MYGFRLWLGKCGFLIFLTVFLLCNSLVSFAALPTPQVDKGAYVMTVASLSCGVAVEKFFPTYFELYKSYLEQAGDTKTLNYLNNLEKLSWGDTVTGIDSFTKNLKAFYDKYMDYSIAPYPKSIKFPCKKTSYSGGWITDFDEYYIFDTPFSDVCTTAPAGYKYLFSRWYATKESSGDNAGRIYNVKCNVFVPTDYEVVGFFSHSDSYFNGSLGPLKNPSMKFFRWDSSSNSRKLCNLKYATTCYWADTGELYKKDSSAVYFSDNFWFLPRDLMNFPVKRFSDIVYMDNYLSKNGGPYMYATGSEGIVYNGTYGCLDCYDSSLSYVGDSLILPPDNDSAYDVLRDLFKNPIPCDNIYTYADGISDRTGFSVGYPIPYTVNYLYDGVPGGSYSGEASSHDCLVSSVPLQDKSGYRLSNSPYSPALPFTVSRTEANTITVNYESFEYPYSVQYYYDGELGLTKQLTVSSLTNTVSQVPAADKSGYRLADQAYTPALPMVIDDKNNVIRVDYVSWAYPYTVEYYYDGTLGETRKFFARSYANTVTEVPEIGKAGYKLADSPYSPALPAVIDDTNNVIRVDYVSWNYPYTVKYYFGSTLKEKRQFSVPSYNNVISNVPLIESGVFKLAESPYKPALPVTINEDNNVIEVHYVSPAALSFSEEMDGTVSNIKRVMVSVIPRAAFFVLLSIFIWFLVKWIRKLLEKG